MRSGHRTEGTFLAFDPAVSLHYKLYKVFKVLNNHEEIYSTHTPASEEPMAKVVYSVVFSSQTRRWEMRKFKQGRCAPRHLQNVQDAFACDINWPSAEYWRGSLYVACENGVLMILNCSEETYDMVQLPGEIYNNGGQTYQLPRRSLLASYGKGVRCAELKDLQLRIWALTRSCDDQLGWTLAHEADLSPHVYMMKHNSRTIESWVTWEMVASSRTPFSLLKQISNNNNGNFIELDKSVTGLRKMHPTYGGIIGLHPRKDVLLLDIGGIAVAYHINTSRMQCYTNGF
ncbi:hypothetical protein VPH35_080545 [Triticum aestivum]|uniref:F-box associated domain-containing protein n=1 Tax=Aegilops tauschii TaxID=37682 RepID=R7WBJ5_AEGTA